MALKLNSNSEAAYELKYGNKQRRFFEKNFNQLKIYENQKK